MIRVWIVVLILGLILGGSGCGRSTEKTKEEHAIGEYEKELNLMEKEVIEEEPEDFGKEMGDSDDSEDDWGDDDKYLEID